MCVVRGKQLNKTAWGIQKNSMGFLLFFKPRFSGFPPWRLNQPLSLE
jgi:hypothetical protein